MESLAYLHLALAYETSEPSESGIQLEQMGEKGLEAEISNSSLSISSLPGTQLIQNWVPSFKLNLLTRVKSIALVLVLLLSSPLGASLCQCGYVCDFQRSRNNGLVVNRKFGVHTRNYLKKSQRHRVYRKTNKGKVYRTSTLQLGSKGEKVVELKQRLESLGYLTAYETYGDNVFNPKTQEAVKEFQNARNLQPDGIVGAKTNKALNEALFPSSMSARALFNRGLKQYEFSDALQDYNEAIKRDENLAEAYYRRGMLYAYANEFADIDRDINKALNDFTEATNKNPDYAEAYLQRGIIHNENKNWKSAIYDWDRVILIEPENTQAYYRRSKAKEELAKEKNGNYKNAIKDAINDCIKNININLTSEQDTDLKKQIETAINNFKNNQLDLDPKIMIVLFRAIASAGASESLVNNNGFYNIESENSYRSEDDALKEVIESQTYKKLNKNIKDLFLYYQALNQYKLGSQKFKDEEILASFKPEIPFASANYYRGLLLLKIGKQKEATEEFDKAINRQATFTKAYYQRGIILSKQEDDEKAISDFQKYLIGDPEIEEAKNSNKSEQKERACIDRKIPKEYLETLLIPSLPLNALAYVRRGKLRFLLGDYPGAKRDFKKAEDEAKRGKEVNSNLAEVYYQQGRVAAYEFYFFNNRSFEKAREAIISFNEALDSRKKITNLYLKKEVYFQLGYLQYILATYNENFWTQLDDEKAKKDVFKNAAKLQNKTVSFPQTDSAWLKTSQDNFRKSIEVDKNFAPAYYFLVVSERFKISLEKQKGNIDKEISNLTEAIRNDIYFYSDFSHFYAPALNHDVGWKKLICSELGNSEEDNITESIDVIPFKYQKERGYYTMALDSYRKRQYQEVIESIGEAIKLNPDIPDYYTIRGAAYYLLNENSNDYYTPALKNFNKSLQLLPKGSDSSFIPHFLTSVIFNKKYLNSNQLQDKKNSEFYYDRALSSLEELNRFLSNGGDKPRTDQRDAKAKSGC